MTNERSETIGREAELVMLLRHKWQEGIERAVDKVKLGTVPARRRTKAEKWFRKQWYRALAVSKRRDIRFRSSPKIGCGDDY